MLYHQWKLSILINKSDFQKYNFPSGTFSAETLYASELNFTA